MEKIHPSRSRMDARLFSSPVPRGPDPTGIAAAVGDGLGLAVTCVHRAVRTIGASATGVYDSIPQHVFAFGARWRKFTLVVVEGGTAIVEPGTTVGFGLWVSRGKEGPGHIALSGARPPPSGLPSDDPPGLPSDVPWEPGGRTRSRVSGIGCMRAAGLLACASNRPHMRPIIPRPQGRKALRACRVSCAAFP
jgi:hypothetical protein